MAKQYIMRQLITTLAAALLVFTTCSTHAQTGPVGRFHKVIISPYIQVIFVQGDEESVTIDHIMVGSNKLHVEVQDGTLRLYLDGAKDFPHDQQDGNQQNHHLYPDHAVIATVVYRKLDALRLRGTETCLCRSPLSADKFTLRVYGESTVNFTEVHISKMYTTAAIAGQSAKVTAFGEAEFRVNVSDRIKITAIGEARLCYMGNPEIVKGIHIGGVDLQKLD
jgi:Putative auto-transporter adhesin, head GIN domain